MAKEVMEAAVAAQPAGFNDESPEPTGCGVCGSETIEQGRLTPLCVGCRTTLANRPVPSPICIAAGLCCLLVIVAFIKFPATLRAGLANERAARAEQRADFVTAEKEYLAVTKIYPDYTEGLVKLADDSYKCADYATTVTALEKISGRKVRQEQEVVLNRIEQDLEKKAQEANGGTR